MNKKVIAIIIVVLFLLIGGGIFMSRRGGEPTPTPTPEIFQPQEEPTQVPEVEVDISTFKVKVLNGTAIAGLAAKVQASLEEAGFTVSGVGNADKKDYQQVVIQAKESVPASAITKLKDELAKTYTVGTQEELASDNEDDIVVIVGTKTPPTPTAGAVKPTTATTPAATATVTITATPTPTKTP